MIVPTKPALGPRAHSAQGHLWREASRTNGVGALVAQQLAVYLSRGLGLGPPV